MTMINLTPTPLTTKMTSGQVLLREKELLDHIEVLMQAFRNTHQELMHHEVGTLGFEHTITSLRKELENSRREKQHQFELLTAIRVELGEMTDSADHWRDMYEGAGRETVKTIRKELADCNENLAAADWSNGMLTEDLHRCGGALDGANAKIERLTSRSIEDLKHELEEVRSDRSLSISLSNENARIRTEIERENNKLCKELEEVKEERDELLLKLDAKDGHCPVDITDDESKCDTVSQLRKELADHKACLEVLGECVNDLHAENGARHRANLPLILETHRLSEELEEVRRERDELSTMCFGSDMEPVDRLRKKLEEVKEAAHHWHGMYERMERDRDYWRRWWEAADEAGKFVGDEMKELRKRVEELEGELEEMEMTHVPLPDVNYEIKGKDKQIASLIAAGQALRAKGRALHAENHDCIGFMGHGCGECSCGWVESEVAWDKAVAAAKEGTE